MTKPLFSVVIPTFNRPVLLARAVASALSQTLPDMEVLVVDDGSVEDIEAVTKASGDNRVSYLRRRQRGGGSAARNSGIEAASGRFIAFLDSDDEWLPGKLERQLSMLEFKNVGSLGLVVCGFVRKMNGKTRTGMPRVIDSEEPFEDLLMDRGGPLTSSVMVICQSVVSAGIRFDEELPALQDLDFALQVSRQFGVKGLKEPLVVKHREPSRDHTFNPTSELEARERLLIKYRVDLADRPSAFAANLEKLALARARLGLARPARAALTEALSLRSRPGSIVLYAATWGPPRFVAWVGRLLRLFRGMKSGRIWDRTSEVWRDHAVPKKRR